MSSTASSTDLSQTDQTPRTRADDLDVCWTLNPDADSAAPRRTDGVWLRGWRRGWRNAQPRGRLHAPSRAYSGRVSGDLSEGSGGMTMATEGPTMRLGPRVPRPRGRLRPGVRAPCADPRAYRRRVRQGPTGECAATRGGSPNYAEPDRSDRLREPGLAGGVISMAAKAAARSRRSSTSTAGMLRRGREPAAAALERLGRTTSSGLDQPRAGAGPRRGARRSNLCLDPDAVRETLRRGRCRPADSRRSWPQPRQRRTPPARFAGAPSEPQWSTACMLVPARHRGGGGSTIAAALHGRARPTQRSWRYSLSRLLRVAAEAATRASLRPSRRRATAEPDAA